MYNRRQRSLSSMGGLKIKGMLNTAPVCPVYVMGVPDLFPGVSAQWQSLHMAAG